jgi:hypothetical protein
MAGIHSQLLFRPSVGFGPLVAGMAIRLVIISGTTLVLGPHGFFTGQPLLLASPSGISGNGASSSKPDASFPSVIDSEAAVS